jgi:hypothetical protein
VTLSNHKFADEKTISFSLNSGIRAVFTFGETLAGLVIAASAFDLFTFKWASSLGQAAVAATLSLLTSLASKSTGDQDSPSLIATVR